REWKKRPTSVLLRDDWAGHRHPFTGEPVGDKDAWTTWDHALAYAVQTIEDFTDQYGIPQWQLDDEAVEVDAVKKIHKFKAAVDRATSGSKGKDYRPAPGEMFVPDIWSRRSD